MLRICLNCIEFVQKLTNFLLVDKGKCVTLGKDDPQVRITLPLEEVDFGLVIKFKINNLREETFPLYRHIYLKIAYLH